MAAVQEEFKFEHPLRPYRLQWKVVPVGPWINGEKRALDGPAECAAYWNDHIASAPTFDPEVESVVCIALNTRLRPKGHQVISIGTVNEATLHVREVFRAAIVSSAFSVVLMHNHPSGDPSPSSADIAVTRRLREAGLLLRIHLQDHVIVGDSAYYSFRECGML